MTDKELCDFGERLYESVLFTPLPAATIFNLALAVRQAVAWAQLPQHLKFAVFKIAASCVAEPDEDDVPDAGAATGAGSAEQGTARSAPPAAPVAASARQTSGPETEEPRATAGAA